MKSLKTVNKVALINIMNQW